MFCLLLTVCIVEKVVDSARLRPEELNQQNIEALVAESNLVGLNDEGESLYFDHLS